MNLSITDKEVAEVIADELTRQRDGLELIASENFVSAQVLAAQGSVLTNKYAEGYPGKRYYGGCEFVDVAENLARDRVKKLFGAEYANVQPHSGSQANMAIYFTFLNLDDEHLVVLYCNDIWSISVNNFWKLKPPFESCLYAIPLAEKLDSLLHENVIVIKL